MASDSKSAVVMALAGNAVLTVIKFAAYLVSHSSAMLAEAIHSAADTGNQALLLIGIRSATKDASVHHPFGFLKDQFVWALLSAAGIFFLGCGVTVTHGIHALMGPDHSEPPGALVFGVLLVSLVLDGSVLFAALRQVNHARGKKAWLDYLRGTDDTATLAVLFEDGAATLGVILAALGIFATHYLHIWWADGAATVAIGVLLGIIAIYLIRQNRAYLIDRSVGSDVQRQVLGLIKKARSVSSIREVQSRILGAGRFQFKAEVEFDGKVISDRVQQRMNLLEAYERLGSAEDLDQLLDEHARVVIDELGETIDRIEAQIREEFPQASFIELEPD